MKKKNNREPIYALIYTNLRNQIFNGQLSAGDLLPSENQLSSNYKVSRETVRRGLKALESEGLIYSRPKVGYFVSLPNYSDVTVSFTVNPTDCRTHYKDIHAVMPDAEVRKVLNIPEDRIVIELSQVTDSVEGTPVAYDIKYILYEQAYPSVESEIRFAVFPSSHCPRWPRSPIIPMFRSGQSEPRRQWRRFWNAGSGSRSCWSSESISSRTASGSAMRSTIPDSRTER